jgi:hypothetical protein
MCSQYSAAEFPQRGDNPGNLAGFDPARIAGSRAARCPTCVGGRPRTQGQPRQGPTTRPGQSTH